MPPLAAIWHRLTAIVLRRRLDRDLDEEVAFHLAMREAEYREAGLTAAEARDAARRRFGSVAHVKEQTRTMWTFPSFESLAQDVGYAFRTLRRSPGFTIVAVLAMALGIGGTTAIFSLLDAVRDRALPYPQADRLVVLWGNVMRAKIERRGASYPDFLDWRARATSFEDVAAYDPQNMTLSAGGETERINAEFVSAPYFRLVGVSPARGRTFQPDEDDVTRPALVVLMSDGLWKRRFGSDPEIVGRTVMLNARAYTVVGLMPPRFKGLTDTAEVWIPFALYAPPAAMAERGNRGFAALARLRPGVALAAAQSELDAISASLQRTYPNTNEKRGVEASPLAVELFGDLRPALLTLMAAVGFVLLIACANVANLLIARSEARRREIAVRTALGAGWSRLLRQLVTESCVLTFVGAAAGLLLAQVAVRTLISTSPVTFPSFVAPRIDARVAAFTVLVSLACGIVVGLAPGLQVRVAVLADALKESARGGDGRRSQRMRGALVIAEVSLAVVLLMGAGLMIRTVRNLAALDPGFDPDSVLALHVSIPRVATAPAEGGAAVAPGPPRPVVEGRALLDRILAVPGVAAAGLATDAPLDGNSSATFYAAEGQSAVNAQTMPRAYVHRVSPGFFSTLRIPLVGGRTFEDTEATPASTAVIVSDRVQKRFWPNQTAVGRRVKFGSLTSGAPWLTIVGVVGEVKYRGLPDNPTGDPDIYLPLVDRNSQVAVVVRATVPPASLAAPVRAAIRAADASIPVYSVATMDDLMREQTSQSRFTTWLMGVFAATALLLAVVGIYGVMSYLVTQRTREIGIRLALGATPSDVRRLIVGSGARMIAAGIVIGVAAAFALGRLLGSLLYGVTTTDAAAAGAVAVLAIVALAACYVPAVRATRVDPLLALRYE
jgi:putative ABC transport system permease protein